MANKKISALTAAGTLTGTEPVPIVQGGQTVRTTTADIAGTSPLGTGTAGYALIGNGASIATYQGFLQTGTGATTRTWNAKVQETVSVKDFGAVGNGVTDDYTAFAAALLATSGAVFVPAGTYRLSAGITITGGKKLFSTGFIPGNPPTGAKLVFDLAVATCVTLDGTGLTTVGFSGLTVTRAAGSIPAGSIGVFVNLGYQMNFDNIWSDRHAIGYKWLAAGSDGISSDCFRLYTGAVTEYHLVADSWPELRVALSRFGMNGPGNQSCTAYLKITGGTGIGGIGPNTLVFNQCQFNQGANFPSYWVELIDLIGEFATAAEYKFQQCHIEGVTTAAVKTTSNVSGIDRFTLVNNTFNNPTIPFFDLDAATRPFQWFFSDNFFFCSTFNLAPTLSFQRVTITGGRISGTSSFTGASGSIMMIQGVYFSGALTFAGAWAMLYATGVIEAGVTDTSTGRKFLHLADLLIVQNNTSASPVDVINTLDSASVLVGKSRGDRATPTNNDTLTYDWQLNNSSGTAVTAFRENIRLGTITAGAETASVFWSIRSAGAVLDKLQFTPTVLAPVVNAGLALGGTTVSWSDLFLANGGVINWNAGDVTITHSANTLAFAGATSGYLFDDVVAPTKAGLPLQSTNSTDNASVETANFSGTRATPTNNDTNRQGYYLNSSTGVAREAYRQSVRMTSVTNTAETSLVFWSLLVGGAVTDKLQFTSTALAPVANDGLALGATTVGWADLFLAAGGVINWANGEVTLTETDANTLTLAGAATNFDVQGPIQVDSLRIDQTPTAVGTGTKTISNAADSSTNFGHYISFNANGTTYYIPCSSVAPT